MANRSSETLERGDRGYCYAGKGFPSFVVPHDRLMEWENIGLENVTVLLNTDHFLTAASRLFEMYDMAERKKQFAAAFT